MNCWRLIGVGGSLLLAGALSWPGCTLDRAGLASGPVGPGGSTPAGTGGSVDGGSSPGGGGTGGTSVGGGNTGGAGGAGGAGGVIPPVCGNGIEEAGEQCDDGNQNNGDSCPDAANYGGTCQNAICGDGFLWNTDGGYEQCDDGDLDNSDSCPDDEPNGGTCQDAICGDGHIWDTDNGYEVCDDGDLDNSDSCPDDEANGGTCRAAMCGDGHTWNTDGGDETCEDGDLDNSDSCPDDGNNGGTCVAAICSDGLIWSTDGGSEQCDDHGTATGDGCGQTCLVECPDGYSHPNTHHCYRVFTDPRTWLEAQTDCRALGAGWDLASITSDGERDYFDQTIDRGGDMWIGGNDLATEGTFVWSNGELWDHTIWDSGEPNGGTGENCVEMEEHVGANNDEFNDENCATGQQYLCELTPAGS